MSLFRILQVMNVNVDVDALHSLRKQLTFCDFAAVSPQNDWPHETTEEIPYWWRVNTHIWVGLVIDRTTREICFNQSEVLARSG